MIRKSSLRARRLGLLVERLPDTRARLDRNAKKGLSLWERHITMFCTTRTLGMN